MRNIQKPMAARFTDTDPEQDIAYRYRRRVGRELRALREGVAMTQEDLARKLDITGAAVSGMELGRVSLAPDRYEEIADIYGLDREQFGKFLLRYSNPWLFAMLYGHQAKDLRDDLEAIPARISREE
jgi:transcriptional regulator with XRE-family HTH domain